MSDLPLVSIIIPCRNEEKFIGACLESITANDYPKNCLEILVVDGMSEDGTRAIVEAYARGHVFVRLVDNSKKIVPVALNIGMGSARGEIIMRMDAHATYDCKYISKCVKALDEHEAGNVGGVWRIVPRNNTVVGRAIVRSLSHRFGVGNAHYRLANSKKPRWVDTVPFFCCKKNVFQKVGPFNEALARGQDMEFNLRLKSATVRTLLVPDIVSYYYARSDMKSYWKHNWTNGVWVTLPFLYSDIFPVCWRHLVPLAFVLGLFGSAMLGVVSPVGLWLVAAIAGAYAVANVGAAAQVATRERDVRYFVVMPVIFASLHVGYGLGSLWGLFKVLVQTVSRFGWKREEGRRLC